MKKAFKKAYIPKNQNQSNFSDFQMLKESPNMNLPDFAQQSNPTIPTSMNPYQNYGMNFSPPDMNSPFDMPQFNQMHQNQFIPSIQRVQDNSLNNTQFNNQSLSFQNYSVPFSHGAYNPPSFKINPDINFTEKAPNLNFFSSNIPAPYFPQNIPMNNYSHNIPLPNYSHNIPLSNYSMNNSSQHSNIVAIEFKQLENEEGIATGLPIKCKECSGLLSKVSKPYIKPTAEGVIWNCEYCASQNTVKIEDEEALNKSIVTYILGNETIPKIESMEEQKVPKLNVQEDISIVFCIDISGSMNGTIYVKDAKPMKYSQSNSGPTRLECVKLAIDSQIQQMLKETPNMKVGFVFFEDYVSVYGDCSNPSKEYNGSILNNFEGLLEAVGAQSNMYFSQPVKSSAPKLLQKLGEVYTGGGTALGPGLVGALGLAIQGKTGSKIIICTDGQANQEMGNIDNPEEARPFYNKVGQLAKEKGIQISIISIVESECRLDMLSPIADLTGGNILRVNPLNLTNDFADFIAEKIVATKVNVEIRLHKALKFYMEDESNFVNGNKSILKKQIGNVTLNSVLSFEYGVKSEEELKLIPNFDINTLTVIPLQSVIYYENLKGFKCIRVISDTIETTDKVDEANEGRAADVIAAHGMQVVQKLAEKGAYKEAEMASHKIMFQLKEDIQSNQRIQQNYLPMHNAIQSQNAMPSNSAQIDNLTSAMNRAKKYY